MRGLAYLREKHQIMHRGKKKKEFPRGTFWKWPKFTQSKWILPSNCDYIQYMGINLSFVFQLYYTKSAQTCLRVSGTSGQSLRAQTVITASQIWLWATSPHVPFPRSRPLFVPSLLHAIDSPLVHDIGRGNDSHTPQTSRLGCSTQLLEAYCYREFGGEFQNDFNLCAFASWFDIFMSIQAPVPFAGIVT